MIRREQSYFSILEAAYQISDDDGSWLGGIVDAIGPTLDAGLGVMSYILRADVGSLPAQTIRTSGMSQSYVDDWITTAGGRRNGDSAMLPSLQDPERQAFFLPRPRATTMRRLHLAGGTGVNGWAATQLTIMADGIGIRGTSPDGQSGIIIAAPSRQTVVLTGRRQALFDRIGSHLATAFRLRTALNGQDPFAAAEAVLSSRGRLLHIADAVGVRVSENSEARRRTAFLRGSRRVQSARSLAQKGEQEGALATWRALLDGRWSVIAHRDNDGKRFLLAIANPPDESAALSLSGPERQVLARLAVDHSLKLVSYELGLSRSAVSGLVRSALRKLRIASISEAVRLFGREARRSK